MSSPAVPTETVERWGWEFRDPRVPVTTFAERPPGLTPTTPEWAGPAAARWDRAVRGRRGTGRLSVGTACVTVGVGVPFGPLAAAGPAALTLVLATRAWLRPVWRRRRADAAYQRWLTECVAAHTSTRERAADWWRRRAEHDREAQRRVAAEPAWVPVRPTTVDRADVCGGTAASWSDLLRAMAGSLLDTGARITILDLSGDQVAGPLSGLAERRGYRVSRLTLPEDASGVNLLAGLSADELGVMVSEAVHAAGREPSHEARSVDADVLAQVCDQLTEPVTFARLHAALRVLLRQEPDGDPVLTRSEHDALSDLFGEVAGRGAEQRVFRLAAAVRRLATLGDDPAGGPPLVDDGAALRVVEVSDQATELTGELLCQVLFQLTARALRPEAEPGAQVLVVPGADCLPRAQVERLDRLARRRGTRLIMMFRHLREDAVDLLGGGEAAVFMRLGNAKEAEAAANFIGREHRLVASQFTWSRSDSGSVSTSEGVTTGTSTQESTTTGTNASRSRARDYGVVFTGLGRGGSDSEGTSDSTTTGTGTSRGESTSRTEQTGTSFSESFGYQRSYDYTVTPKFLQELSPTSFVLVDPRDPGSPRLGDCDPAILNEPGVADRFVLPTTGRPTLTGAVSGDTGPADGPGTGSWR